MQMFFWFSMSTILYFRLLYMFSQHERNVKDNDNLSITYFVAGLQLDQNGNKVLYLLEV